MYGKCLAILRPRNHFGHTASFPSASCQFAMWRYCLLSSALTHRLLLLQRHQACDGWSLNKAYSPKSKGRGAVLDVVYTSRAICIVEMARLGICYGVCISNKIHEVACLLEEGSSHAVS